MRNLLILGVLLASPFVAQAQRAGGPSATARVSPRSVFANQPFTLEVIVTGADNVQPPTLPNLDGLVATYRGVNNQIRIVNGVRSTTKSFTYNCRISTIGLYTIGGITVQADGKDLTTPLITINVGEPPDPSDRLFVEIRSDAETVYVGQQVEVTLAIGIKPPKLGRRPLEGGEVFSLISGNQSDLGPFPSPERYYSENRKLPSGETVEFYVYPSTTKIVPTEPGPLRFDNVVIGLNYPTDFRRDVFGRYQITDSDPLTAIPAPSKLIVKPLPTEGRPSDFSGAVGRYNLIAKAEPTEVRVGDPIEVTLTLTGDGPIEQIVPPDFTNNPELQRNFRVSDEPVGARTENGRKIFSLVVRARDPNVTEIPVFSFPHFDPESESYRIARSRAIPLHVSAVETLDMAAIEGLETERKATRNTSRLDGLRGNITTESTLLATQSGPSMTTVIVSQTMPAGLFLVGWIAAGLRRRSAGDSAKKRRAQAAGNALRLLSDADRSSTTAAAAAILNALGNYFGDRLNEPAEKYHGAEAYAALERLDAADSLSNDLHALVEQCESAAYAGAAAGDAEQMLANARQLIDRLERTS